MIRLVYFNWMEPQKYVHPLILEYGNKSRQEELDLIARFKQLVQSPCLMDEDGNIHE